MLAIVLLLLLILLVGLYIGFAIGGLVLLGRAVARYPAVFIVGGLLLCWQLGWIGLGSPTP